MVLYAEIGREVERNGLDSVTRRAVVPPGRKIRALSRILQRCSGEELQAMNRILAEEPLEANRFLVDAVRQQSVEAGVVRPTALAMGRLEHRLMWLHNLFLRLEQRDGGGVQRGTRPRSPVAG
jgi:phytoene synthase